METSWHDRIIMAIPSINGGHLLERMLPSLRFKPSNVIVLDQGSSDDTLRICQAAGVELVQLGRPHTYTEACNVGAQIARQRGYPFLCASNNDITFRTNVLFELLGEMERDIRLGIVAPSQIILDPANSVDVLSRRVSWNLDTVEFLHEVEAHSMPPRIEADFCELTCALIRMSAVEEVGFLDDDFGFYHEDADFCFRLRQAGYSAAYLPQSQIYHYTSSTFNNQRAAQIDYQRRNRVRFAEKHLGYGVRQAKDYGSWASETETFATRLRPFLRRFGMTDDTRPELVIGRIGSAPTDFLLTTQRSSEASQRWVALRDRYQTVLAPSDAAVHGLRAVGFASFRVPLGIDPDVFNPWGLAPGPASRHLGEITYLAIFDQNDRRLLTLLFQAWSRFIGPGRRARLIVVGSRLTQRMGRTADTTYRSGRTEIFVYAAEQVELYESVSPMTDQELALLYRSVDFTVIVTVEGATLTLLESLACGTLVLFDAAYAGAVTLYREATGGLTPLHAQDGETQPVDGMLTTEDGLLAALLYSERVSAAERIAWGLAVSYGILGHSTLRHTVMALREALVATQEREPARFVRRLEKGLPRRSYPESFADPLGAKHLRVPISAVMAKSLTKLAGTATRFGEVWQQKGLPAAVFLSIDRLQRAKAPPILGGPVRLSPKKQVVAVKSKQLKAMQASPLLIGYIDAQLGIGQSLRGLAAAMAEAQIEFSIYPFGVGVEGRRSVPMMPERYDEVTPHNTNIIEVSPAELPRVFSHVSANHFDGSYNILRTYWELAKGPASWRKDHGMERIDEIWAPNAYCATAFRDFFDGPIIIVPPCIGISESRSSLTKDARDRFGLAPNILYFMFSFDYHSFPERKNPLAVVRAFLAAFPDSDSPVGLVVKATSAAGHFPAIKKAILAAARADGRITIIDASLSRHDMLSLIASTDCYVSLHRSEGFGLGMAEAMALEKPVIATDYSGNCEFLTECTGYPIPFKLKPVASHEYVHTEGQVWAEPDEEACAEAMRSVANDPDQAASRAAAGRAFVDERYGAANVGRLAGERLEEIRLSRMPKQPS